MTPKEKAQELFDKYYQLVSYPTPNWRNIVKQSSVIAVDEILNHHSQEQGLYRIDTYYWKEVKQEIEKL